MAVRRISAATSAIGDSVILVFCSLLVDTPTILGVAKLWRCQMQSSSVGVSFGATVEVVHGALLLIGVSLFARKPAECREQL